MHASTFTNAGSPVNNTEVVHRINSNQSSPLKGTLKAKAWCCKPFLAGGVCVPVAGPAASLCSRPSSLSAFFF